MIPFFIRHVVQSQWWGQPQRDAACDARAIRLGLAALILSLLMPAGASGQSHSPYYFRELEVDSGLHLILTGGINLPTFKEPDVGSYYAPFHGAFVTSVDHREKKPEPLYVSGLYIWRQVKTRSWIER